MENKTRIFGGKDDTKFWCDKPIQEGHPNFKNKTKWYHFHYYNIPYNPIHKSTDKFIIETMNSIILYKCRCGKTKNYKLKNLPND